MTIHAARAGLVKIGNDEQWIYRFRRFSVVVWGIVLVPYYSPMIFGMG
jgi:hypothetical protein